MRFVPLFEAARCNRVSENKERFLVSKLWIEPLDQELVLMVEHSLQASAADIAVCRSINCVAECHVVRRHGLRDRAGRAADTKEPARDFLPGTDFSEGPIFG